MRKTFWIIFAVVAFFGLMVVLAGLSVGYLSSRASVRSDSLLVVSFANRINEQSPMMLFRRKVDFHQVVGAVRRAARDSDIKAVLVYGNSLPLSLAQKEELREALSVVIQAKKPVTVYFDAISIKNYYVVPKGAKVVTHNIPGGYVSLTGYYLPQLFMRELLESKLGIKMNVIHIGDYKSAGETYSRDSMSRYLREELTSFLDDVWNNFIESIPQVRDLDSGAFREALYKGDFFGLTPEAAKKAKLVDGFAHKLDLEDRYPSTVSINRYAQRNRLNLTSSPIALIIGEGEIVMGTDHPSLLSRENVIACDTMCRTIRDAADDSDVKAIVFRINSPGGSALASELIYEELKRAAAKKPVIASIGGMGASGGYYIACGCDSIFSDNASLVGSIGVVSIVPEVTQLLNKVGVHVDEVKKGKYADFLTPYEKMDPEHEKLLTDEMNKVYELFKSRVSTSRKIDMDTVEKIARGRIYSGEKGKKLGLIDEIGGLRAALKEAAKRAKLSHVTYAVYGSRRSWLEMLADPEIFSRVSAKDLLELPPMDQPLLLVPGLKGQMGALQ